MFSSNEKLKSVSARPEESVSKGTLELEAVFKIRIVALGAVLVDSYVVVVAIVVH